jgi:ribonuclease T1
MFKNLIFTALLLLSCFACRNKEVAAQHQSNNQPEDSAQSDNSQRPDATTKKGKAPDYVLEVLEYVKQNDRAPKGYVGGRNFQNRENRLPKISNQGAKIKYQEWDVYPKEQGKNRGVERLITGSDKSAWYTKNHYKSFVKVE